MGQDHGSGGYSGLFYVMEYTTSPNQCDGSRTTIRIIINLMTGLQVSLTPFFVVAVLLRVLHMGVLPMLVYIFNCFVRRSLIVLVVKPSITLSPIVLVQPTDLVDYHLVDGCSGLRICFLLGGWILDAGTIGIFILMV